jgi:hypothetical protein
VKDPDLCWKLGPMLEEGRLNPAAIGCLVVPLRGLSDAAASRVLVTIEHRDIHAPGGLVRTAVPSKQRAVLAEEVYGLMLTAARWELPLLLIEYPKFARDPRYAFRRLASVMQVDEERFFDAWSRTADKALVRDEPITTPPLADLRVRGLRLRRYVRSRVAMLL